MSDLAFESGISLSDDVVPVFYCRERADASPEILDFAGTAFRLGPELVVSCWHCVRTDAERHGYAAAFLEDDGTYLLNPLLDIAQDANGSDLATARLFSPRRNKWPLRVAEKNLAGATDVWTYGYPLTERLSDEGRFRLHGRYLEGYITRSLWLDHPTYGRVGAYEVDMPAPDGISGAPLLRRQGGITPEVVGVVFGLSEAGAIDEFASVDPATGQRTPEIQRLVSFAAVHYTETLANLTGPATANRPLKDFLAELPSA